MKVISKTLGTGTVINHDGGNITVDFNGNIKTLIVKFANLTTEDGIPFGEQFTQKPSRKSKHEKRIEAAKREAALTPEQRAKRDRNHARFMEELDQADLAANFLPCQTESGNYNINLID